MPRAWGAGLAAVAELEAQFQQDLRVPGCADEPNGELEKALRLSYFFGLAQLMLRDALAREESCGAHFREEHQTPEGEALRDDGSFAHIAAWQYQPGSGEPNQPAPAAEPLRHSEPMQFTLMQPSTRNYR